MTLCYQYQVHILGNGGFTEQLFSYPDLVLHGCGSVPHFPMRELAYNLFFCKAIAVTVSGVSLWRDASDRRRVALSGERWGKRAKLASRLSLFSDPASFRSMGRQRNKRLTGIFPRSRQSGLPIQTLNTILVGIREQCMHLGHWVTNLAESEVAFIVSKAQNLLISLLKPFKRNSLCHPVQD